jgi:hypothetical protein
MPSSTGDRHARDPVAGAQPLHLGHGGLGPAGHRVGDHAGLGPLDHVDLLRLLVHGQVAVQHADTALAGHGHRHPGLGDRVHGRGHQRHPQRDTPGQPGGDVRFVRQDRRMRGQEQNVVEGERGRSELAGTGQVTVGIGTAGHASS